MYAVYVIYKEQNNKTVISLEKQSWKCIIRFSLKFFTEKRLQTKYV